MALMANRYARDMSFVRYARQRTVNAVHLPDDGRIDRSIPGTFGQ